MYAPYYMPKTHPKWQWSNQQLIDEVISYLPMINPAFKPEWIKATHCHRYEYAQTICPPGFEDMLPPMKTPVEGSTWPIRRTTTPRTVPSTRASR